MSRRSPGVGSRRLDRVLLILAALAASTVVASGFVGATEPTPAPEETRLHAFTLEHLEADLAVDFVYDLLSERGTVQIQPGGNTLVIRDSLSNLERIVAALTQLDRPAPPIWLEVIVVEAGRRDTARRDATTTLPAAIESRLSGLFRYDGYSVVSAAEFEVVPGDRVTYQVGDDLEVDFRLENPFAEGRIKLRDFGISRGAGPNPSDLMKADLNLRLDRPTILGLAKSESSTEALMLVLICRLAPESAQSDRHKLSRVVQPG